MLRLPSIPSLEMLRACCSLHRITAFSPSTSENPEPSAADRALIQRLKEALGLADVRVLDHVNVAGSTTESFSERGGLI
ncbi:JAB domain-containing protein [Pseudomonas aeruginosa]|uniref:JAB domain-containing protein n=1 Tax=Pseudomonas aeruginosa TaxID=287 RepID=UPI003D69787E